MRSNIAKLAITLLILIAFSVFMIKITLQGAKELRNVSSIYLKIMMNHIQLISVIASFNFKWPD